MAESHPSPLSLEHDGRVSPPITASHRRAIQVSILALVILGLAAVLPPLINVNRYQRRVASSIAQSLGRPVHMDAVTMNLLPLPGFTLRNFVVVEDPAFGSEPIIRADTVRANLRLRSLWHRRVEFSRIVLDEPSVNLVHRADGQWNIESILLSASRIPVVPTGQATAAVGGIQRFPYIEATGARVNFKEGLEKTPISLTDAEFALWLSQPKVWKLRLTAHPSRTDATSADAGLLRVQGTLGKAGRLDDVPIDLQVDWTAAPLGAASGLIMGRDAGLRGDLTLHTSASGTVSSSSTAARLQIRRLRRAEFVPARTLDLDVNCNASALFLMRRLESLQCATSLPEGDGATLTGNVPDLLNWRSAEVEGQWKAVSASLLLDVLRVASPGNTAALQISGASSGDLLCCAALSANLTMSGLRVSNAGAPPFIDQPAGPSADLNSGVFTVTPIPLDLGAAQPATLSAEADASRLTLRLSGSMLRSRLLALADAFPQFGQGLAEVLSQPSPGRGPEIPLRLDLVASRPWGEVQTWSKAPVPLVKSRRR